MKLSEMSAIELQREIDHAENSSSEYSGPELFEALKEIERLRIVCQDIVEVIGVEYAQGGDADRAIAKIDDIAHKYWIPPT